MLDFLSSVQPTSYELGSIRKQRKQRYSEALRAKPIVDQAGERGPATRRAKTVLNCESYFCLLPSALLFLFFFLILPVPLQLGHFSDPRH